MYEQKTYDQLRKLLEKDSCGNILEALADLYKESREGAEGDDSDPKSVRDFAYIEGALRTIALGIDIIGDRGYPN